MHWWMPMGYWEGSGPRARWVGPEQQENRSPENIRRCYSFLRSRPYQSDEDRARLDELSLIAVTEARMTE